MLGFSGVRRVPLPLFCSESTILYNRRQSSIAHKKRFNASVLESVRSVRIRITNNVITPLDTCVVTFVLQTAAPHLKFTHALL